MYWRVFKVTLSQLRLHFNFSIVSHQHYSLFVQRTLFPICQRDTIHYSAISRSSSRLSPPFKRIVTSGWILRKVGWGASPRPRIGLEYRWAALSLVFLSLASGSESCIRTSSCATPYVTRHVCSRTDATLFLICQRDTIRYLSSNSASSICLICCPNPYVF